mgnify:CR=1 FL=1
MAAVRVVVESSNAALTRAGLTTADVDWFLPHQANARILAAVGENLGVDRERVIAVDTGDVVLATARNDPAYVFLWLAAAYVALFILYTHALKHVVILDVMSIAIGFVLRAVAGGLVINVPISDWLLVSIVLLALFLGLSKRRHEITMLADGATGHRRILEEYDPYLLDQMIAIVAAATLVVYIIYCASPETAEKFGTRWLVLTTPFPIYGIFRYLYLVHRKHGGGSPSDMLLRDRPLLGCVALWGLAVILIIYRPYAS